MKKEAVSISQLSSALKVEAVRSSETSVNFYRTIRSDISEDNSVYSHHSAASNSSKIKLSPVLK
jgi:hypothetical protein